MRWELVFVLALASSWAKEEDTNEVTPPRPPINLDSNLRKALLRALTELENEENEKNHQPNTQEKTVEKASASAVSFFASTTPEPTTPETAKPTVVIQKSNSLQHRPIVEKYPSSDSEHFLTSASSSFTASNKFTFANQKEKTPSKSVLKPQKVETTTVTTTTEESEAKVEDVQFFSAPLVAAFTVHQDERGLPRSVEPIFKHKPEIKIKDQKQQQIRTQFALQEKQRALEDEIARLKQQQRQQNYLIRQQQILHEQQLQLQKQKILEEQIRLRNNLQVRNEQFPPAISTQLHPPSQLKSVEFNKGSLVSFQPSITFTSSDQQLPLNAQQLPVKNAVDFRGSFNPPFQQPNYLSHQQLPLTNSGSFNIVSSVQPANHHRVFRQEANPGRFFNDGFNYFNQQQQNRFFRSNGEGSFGAPFNRVEPPVVNQQLNNLLYNSGIIRGKQQEDLNIVSKVLALNHYGGDFRFASSNINEQKLPAPPIKKV